MNEFFTQLRDQWNGLSLKQKGTMLLSAALTVGAIAAMVWWAKQPTWSILYTGLDPKDAQAVVQELQTRKVEHRLTDSGTGVEVPLEAVSRLRMELAAKNLPGSGRFGFMEMFAENGLAQSDRTQKIRYQKALEDELARTIESLDSVRAARVHLVLPGDRVFLDDDDVAKASVTLSVDAGRTPGPDEVRSIVHIVAGAVQGLAVDRVSVVDTAGHTLWEGDGAASGLFSARQQELKAGVEKDINQKVARVLEPLVGAERYVVRTTADMDFQKVLRKERSVDPDSAALVSEQKQKDTSSSSTPGALGGTPGTASNLPGAAAPTPAGGNSEQRETTSTTNNFEYSVVERTVEEPVGTVRRLSIAVLLDHAPQGTPEPGKPRQTAPRSAEDLKKIEQLVKAAVSFSVDRGDVVTVDQAAFQVPDPEPAAPLDWREYLPYLKYPGIVLGLLIVFFLFFRPFMKTARDAVSRVPPAARQAEMSSARAAATAAVENPKLIGSASHVEMLRQRLAQLASEEPSGMAQTLRVWLHEPKESQ